jgi:hypothetical protein
MSREIHHDLPRQAHEKPISPEHLNSINTTLKNITTLPGSSLLTADDLPFAESLYAQAAQDDSHEPNIPDIMGRQWLLRDEGSEIRVAQYYPEFQKELGLFDYGKRTNHLRAHGHIAFRKEVGSNSFSGYIFLLGTGDELQELDIKLERNVDPSDHNGNFVIRQFAGTLGLDTIDSSLAAQDDPQWTGDIIATYIQGREIAESLSKLYHEASSV